MRALFESVQEACSPATWSRGVELSRADAVQGERAGEDEVVVRISERGGLIARTVTLFLDDASWECTCGARACEHAAAAVIALRRARQEGKDLPVPVVESGRISYRFERMPGGLALLRGVTSQGAFQPIEATLAALAQKKVAGPAFAATQADLALELALQTHRRGALPPALLPRLLATLRRCSDVSFEGTPVQVSTVPVLPRAVLSDQGEGFRLVLEDDPTVTEVFANGLALCGTLVRPMGVPSLTGRELQDLSRGRRFEAGEVALLVDTVLPSLARRVPIEVRTSRLPRRDAMPPRIVLDVERQETSLSVLPTLVYGDPPVARVDAGRLVHLQGAIPMRDEGEERRLVRRLALELGLGPGSRARFEGEDAVSFNARLDRWRGEVRGTGRTFFALAPPLSASVRLHGARFEVTFASQALESPPDGPAEGHGTARSADPTSVLRAWREGASLVPLQGGGWAPLPSDWLARFGERLADLLAAREADGTVPRAALPDLARLCEDLDLPIPLELRGLRERLESFTEIPAAVLPPDLAAELRPYQRRGVDWLCFLRDAGMGAMLADDMGLGKTVQALCAIRGRTLVVAPTSVLHNWVAEIGRFRPGLRYAVYHGPRRALDPSADVTVTTYALLRLDEAALGAQPWDTVVLDEAQTIKNPDSQVAAAAYRLRAGFRVTLTGTPVENRLEELWSQVHFANRGLLGGRQDFQERYARPMAEGRPGAAERLRERIRPFLLRRLKKEVAPELPPRTDVVLVCELTEDERRIYDAIHAATREEVVQRLQRGGSVLAALEALLRLRQAACHPSLVPGQHAERSSKLDLLLETLDTVLAEGHKALVFSQWTSLLDLIEPELRTAGVDFLRLDGSTVDRAGVTGAFQDEAGPPVLLVSLKAGGTGLNLTAADHVFLMDPWWNPAVEDQAADRTHRIGQQRPVMVYRLVAQGTVEERILALQESKRAVAEAALGEGGRAAALTREDLLALLE